MEFKPGDIGYTVTTSPEYRTHLRKYTVGLRKICQRATRRNAALKGVSICGYGFRYIRCERRQAVYRLETHEDGSWEFEQVPYMGY